MFLFQYFPDFIDQQLVAFDDENDQNLDPRKKILEFDKPKIKKVDDKFYWVAGPSEIHLLNFYKSEAENFFSKKLSDEEIKELPFDIIYTGPTTTSYSNDEEEAFKIILKIIDEMNAMQEPEWYSFPLGKSEHCSGQALRIPPPCKINHGVSDRVPTSPFFDPDFLI